MRQESENKPVRIIIVDQHPLAREGIRTIINNHHGFSVVAEAGDATAALLAGRNHPHDVILMNAYLPEVDIYQAARDHAQAYPDARIIISYAPEESGFLVELLENGIQAIIGQEANSTEYLAAITTIMAGGCYLSANLMDCIIMQKKSFRNKANIYNLTDRETEILSMLAVGMSNKEVANKLNLSVRTAEAHRLSIRRKTEANTLSDLIRIARTFGLAEHNVSVKEKYVDNRVTSHPRGNY